MKDPRTTRVLVAWDALLSVGLLLTIVLLALAWTKADSAASNNRSNLQQAQVLADKLKKSVQSPTHGKDIALWCNGINATRDYLRGYSTDTLKQSQAEAETIEKAIASPHAHGLTSAQASFIRLYLDSVVALEREVPKTLSLHPFTLGDLNCSQIEAAQAASNPK